MLSSRGIGNWESGIGNRELGIGKKGFHSFVVRVKCMGDKNGALSCMEG
jgi:hypothetical protein